MRSIQNSLALATLALSTPAYAETTVSAPLAAPSTTTARLHLDLEIDPVAYVFSGYSAHVGVGWKRVRLDLGLFAQDFPRFIEPTDGFRTSVDGFGAKLQYFPFAEQAGAFVGVVAQLDRTHVRREGTSLSSLQSNFSAGGQLGWRFTLGAHFYVTPWILLDYTFGAKDVTLGGRTYKSGTFTPYPFIHLGYRFR